MKTLNDLLSKQLQDNEFSKEYELNVEEIRAAMLQEIVDDFIARVDPYKDLEPLKFDLRAYAAYLKENNLDGRDVPEEVIERFRIK